MSYTREQLIEYLLDEGSVQGSDAAAMLRDHAAALKQARREALEEARDTVCMACRYKAPMEGRTYHQPYEMSAVQEFCLAFAICALLDAGEAKPTCPPHDWGELDLNTTLGTACTKCGVLGLTALMGAIKANRNDASEAGEGA